MARPLDGTAVPPDLRGRRVLIIDDNPQARAVLSSMLIEHDLRGGRSSFRVGRNRNGAPWRRKSNKPYEIVFLDWQMPGLDGFETGKQIRALPNLQIRPQLVMVTAYGREEVLKQADENSFANILIKPVTASMLFDSAVQVLGAETSKTYEAAAAPPPNWSESAARASCWSKTTSSIARSRSAC